MKSRFLFSLASVGLCAALLGITGCNGGGDDDVDDSTTTGGLPGTWRLNGATITAPLVGDNASLLTLAGLTPSGDTVSVNSSTLSLFGVAATLIIDEDGTWSLQVTIPGLPGYTTAGTYAAEGTYTLSGNRITLTITSIPSGGADIAEVGDTFTISYSQSGNALDLSATSADTGVPGTAIMINLTR